MSVRRFYQGNIIKTLSGNRSSGIKKEKRKKLVCIKAKNKTKTGDVKQFSLLIINPGNKNIAIKRGWCPQRIYDLPKNVHNRKTFITLLF